jgi:Putative Ig domain.
MLLTSVGSSAAFTGKPGETYFRYKAPIGLKVDKPGGEDPDTESKSVTAFYVAGVGFPFDELLPLKPEWQNDNWRVVSGTLPEGITFDPVTRKFSGTAVRPTSGNAVRLEGYDAAGNFVARASVTFDVVVLQGTPVPVALYAHTGKFKVDELPIPEGLPEGVAIESWARIQALPGGIDLESRYVQGTPMKAGTYPVLISGKDYKGDVVATYFGKYLVEDGPTFNHIPDMVSKLPPLELNAGGLQVHFGAPSTIGVNHVIDPDRGVLYYLEKKDSAKPFPGSVASNDRPIDLHVFGQIADPYKTATVRLKAVDVDGTIGYSNWFDFGTSDPQPDCSPFDPSVIPLVTGVDISMSVPRPIGLQGDVRYNLVSGTLPEGLELDEVTGIISGRALNVGDDQDVAIVVDVTNGSNVVSSRECLYTMKVRAGGVSIGDLTDPQARHVRAGEYYDGVAGVVGGIPDFEVSITDPATLPYISMTSPSLNEDRISLSGQTEDPGRKSIGLTLNNGDGSTHSGSITFEVHGDLAFGQVTDIKVKRMADPTTIARIPFDEDSVIPDVDGEAMPKFEFSNLSALPAGITIDEDGFVSGSTREAVGTYGPFTATMTDQSGATVTSGEFNVIVEDRDPIKLSLREEHEFNVEWDRDQVIQGFSVQQPNAAKGLELTWELASADNSPLPSWLSIDTKTGEVTAAAGIPYSARGYHGPFVATVTDADGSSASLEFSVNLQDWKLPSQGVQAQVKGNVVGTENGETATQVVFPELRALIDPMTVIGGVEEVEFLSASPAAPAGMTFNPATGTFVGVPTEAFEGPVEIAFKDARDRTGTLTVDVNVREYPSAQMDTSYVLPRLARAELLDSPIAPSKNDGYWGHPEWTVDTTRGTDLAPYGLSVDPATGWIIGLTEAEEGLIIPNVVLKATSLGAGGELLRNWTQPFSITVGAPAPISVTYEPSVAKFFLDKDTLALQGKVAAVPVVKGSFKAPLTWSVDTVSEAALAGAGLFVDPATGAITGAPTKLGRWNVAVTATDDEGRSNVAAAYLTVLSTLDGDITLGEPDEAIAEWADWPSAWKASAGRSKILRVDEPFRMPAVPVENAVGDVAFTTLPSPAEVGLVFNANTGEYEAGSRFQTQGDRSIIVDAVDADGRTLGQNRVGVSFLVRSPLSMVLSPAQTSLTARQYSADGNDAISVAFAPVIEHKIGTLDYSIEGDLPGTAVTFDGQEYVWSGGRTTSVEDLPIDAIVFDKTDLTLKGVASRAGTFVFDLVVRDSHADEYLQDTPSRLTNNSARQQVVLNVQPSAPLALEASENPKGVVVPGGNGIMSVTPKYAAYGKASTFSVTGTLPPGITVRTDGTGAYFSGKFTGELNQMGRYDGITVSATDALGRTASLPVSFMVFLSTEAIDLTMAEVKTKVGYPFEMDPTVANFYGNLRFYSYDLAGLFGGQVSLDQATGSLSGEVTAPIEKTTNIYVTDSTNRVTSKPVKVSVLPVLKITVPEQVTARQGDALNRTILTDYKLGNVVYEKVDPELWPEGFDLNPDTGVISNQNVMTAAGTYGGLRIRATDTFQIGTSTMTDTQVSNEFSIVVSEVDARPIISDLSRMVLGRVGSPIQYIQPIVRDDVKNQPWNYGGTVFSTSHDLTQYGLTFDPATGRVSGTPTESFVIPDFVFTVTSAAGDEDSTAPFWMGVQPDGNITVAAGQTTVHDLRVGDALELDAPIFENTGGEVTYSATPMGRGSFDSETGVYQHPEYTAADIGRRDVGITVVDEFGRMGSISHIITVRPALSARFADKAFEPGYAITTSAPAVVGASLMENIRFSSPDLPDFLSINDKTGVISGVVPAGASSDIVITVIVEDLVDGETVETTVSLLKQPEMQVLRLIVHESTHGHACIGHIKLFAGGVDVFQDAILTGASSVYGLPDNLKTEATDYTDALFCFTAGGVGYLDIKIMASATVNQMVIHQRNDVYKDAYMKDISLSVVNPDGSIQRQLFRGNLDEPRSGTSQTFNF